MNVVELASQLISIPTESPPGNEAQCAAFLRDILNDLRLENSDVTFHKFSDSRANLVARIGPRGQPGLLFSGHLDVVPVGDASKWITNPFDPKVMGGKLYGRGAADMKGGLAAMVKAIESVKGLQLKRELVFIATAGEEIGFDGLKALMRDGFVKRREALYCVVGEPSGLRVVRAHKGGTIFRVTFHGRSAHSSRPDLGINAIEHAARFIADLVKLRRNLENVKEEDLGSTVISATIIKGGIKENMIPDICETIVDCRRIPTHSAEYIRSAMETILESLKAELHDLNFNIEEVLSYDALNTPKDHQLVKLATEIVGGAPGVASYGTEAPLYQKLDIPAIILGPGKVEQAHVINEFVDVDELHRAENIYRDMIRRICL